MQWKRLMDATSNGILMLCGQISGLPIVFSFNMTAITMLFVVAFILALLLHDIKASTPAIGMREIHPSKAEHLN